jgi:hypothetical protein
MKTPYWRQPVFFSYQIDGFLGLLHRPLQTESHLYYGRHIIFAGLSGGFVIFQKVTKYWLVYL